MRVSSKLELHLAIVIIVVVLSVLMCIACCVVWCVNEDLQIDAYTMNYKQIVCWLNNTEIIDNIININNIHHTVAYVLDVVYLLYVLTPSGSFQEKSCSAKQPT